MNANHTVAPGTVELSEHFARLCRFLYRDASVIEESGIEHTKPYETEEFWGVVAEPLRIGGSIKNIEANPEIIDPGGSLMCSQAWEYECALKDITSFYTFAVTRFMWAWIAFENLANRCCSEHQGAGITAKVIEYLKGRNKLNLIGLESTYDQAVGIARENVLQRANRAAERTDSSQYLYIHLCREARNELFHSHHNFIEPFYDEEDSVKLKDDSRVVFLESLTRLTLFSIQSVLGVYFHTSTIRTGWLMESHGVPKDIVLSNVVGILHLNDQTTVYQSQLEFNDA